MIRWPSSATNSTQAGRALVWLLVVVLLAGGTLFYWRHNPASAPGWLRDAAPALFVTRTKLYRWQDEAGNWHVSDAPPEGRDYEVVEYRSDANTVPPEGG